MKYTDVHILQKRFRYILICKVDYQCDCIAMPFQNMNNYYRHNNYDNIWEKKITHLESVLIALTRDKQSKKSMN